MEKISTTHGDKSTEICSQEHRLLTTRKRLPMRTYYSKFIRPAKCHSLPLCARACVCRQAKRRRDTRGAHPVRLVYPGSVKGRQRPMSAFQRTIMCKNLFSHSRTKSYRWTKKSKNGCDKSACNNAIKTMATVVMHNWKSHAEKSHGLAKMIPTEMQHINYVTLSTSGGK